MKKLIALLAAASLAGGAFAQSFPDVPSGHWAEDAVEQIAELNIVIGFPDGTFRGNEAFTRYQASLVMSRMLGVIDADMATMDARLSAAESAIAGLSDDVDAAMMSGMDGDALQDVQNQVSAARVATDANANEIAALEESVSDDMASIREFAILLRRNQVALGDRVTALEEQTAGIGELESRVAELETNPLGLSGSVALEYYVGSNSDRDDTLTPFDIDRAYGVGMDRDMGESYFSTGTDADRNPDGDDDLVDEPGEYAEDQGDISYGSGATVDLTLEASYALGGASVDRGLNAFDAVVTLGLIESELDSSADPDDVYSTNLWGFVLEDLMLTYEGIGGAPLTMNYGEAVTGSFTPYTLERESLGLTAALGAPDALAFLDPALHIAYLSDNDGGMTLEEANETVGIRGTLSAIEGLTGGFSVVRHQLDTTDGNLPDDTDESVTVFGLDGAGDFDLGTLGLSVSGEYASASGANPELDAIDTLFVDASTTVDVLGGLTIGGNYRDIDGGWSDRLTFTRGGEDYSIVDADEFPYAENQQGFTVEGSAGIAMLTVGGFFDSYDYDAASDADETVLAWGADASASLFAGFSASAGYTTVDVDETTVADLGGAADPDEKEYATEITAGIAHDGAASDALIADLNLAANYTMGYEDATAEFSETVIDASADYTLSVAGATVTPYASFENVDADGDANDSQTITAGTGLVTEPLDVFLAPSLEAAVNYAQTTRPEGQFDNDELQWSVGLNLGEFLFENSSMAARYGSYTGTNVYFDIDNTNLAENLSEGAENNGTTASVAGFEVEWNYYDLMFGFGQYTNDPDTDVDENDVTAQVFSVAYEVAF